MGIYNARGIAGFLGMEIKNIYLYSGFQNDKLAGEQSLIALRASNNRDAVRKIRQWKEDRYELRIDGENRIFQHQKIQLDSEGNGSVSIEFPFQCPDISLFLLRNFQGFRNLLQSFVVGEVVQMVFI